MNCGVLQLTFVANIVRILYICANFDGKYKCYVKGNDKETSSLDVEGADNRNGDRNV